MRPADNSAKSQAMSERKTPQQVYKVCSAALWSQALEMAVFVGAPIDLADGYIHFSTKSQLRETLKLYFSGQNDLCLLAVDAEALGDALRWEPARNGQLFPHLYGPLLVEYVVEDWPIEVAADGAASLPPGF
jgi:uncharacterized protein (DUF952 family)